MDEKDFTLDQAFREYVTMLNRKPATAYVRQCNLHNNYMTENEREEQERLEDLLPEPEYKDRGIWRIVVFKVIAVILMAAGAGAALLGFGFFFAVSFFGEVSAAHIALEALLIAMAGGVGIGVGWQFWQLAEMR